MSSKWSRRRKTIKRPPVCKSITPEDQQQAWPAQIQINPSWTAFSGLNATSYSGGPVIMPRVGTGPEYDVFITDDQSNTCLATVFLARAPSQCNVLLEITTGPLGGVTFFGLTPGWDGTPTWITMGNLLTCIGATGGGTVDLAIV